MQTIYWRMGSNPELHLRIADLFMSESLEPRHVALLREQRVDWLGVGWRGPLADDVAAHGDLFEEVERVQSLRVFRVLPVR